mmetsp:Transcript_47162/g.106880  ORF Transcript_47162/g.106880 Transcript_47162/m.106880 type:complete len:342 (+) Transcript_47162:1381-2406(+)
MVGAKGCRARKSKGRVAAPTPLSIAASAAPMTERRSTPCRMVAVDQRTRSGQRARRKSHPTRRTTEDLAPAETASAPGEVAPPKPAARMPPSIDPPDTGSASGIPAASPFKAPWSWFVSSGKALESWAKNNQKGTTRSNAATEGRLYSGVCRVAAPESQAAGKRNDVGVQWRKAALRCGVKSCAEKCFVPLERGTFVLAAGSSSSFSGPGATLRPVVLVRGETLKEGPPPPTPPCKGGGGCGPCAFACWLRMPRPTKSSSEPESFRSPREPAPVPPTELLLRGGGLLAGGSGKMRASRRTAVANIHGVTSKRSATSACSEADKTTSRVHGCRLLESSHTKR